MAELSLKKSEPHMAHAPANPIPSRTANLHLITYLFRTPIPKLKTFLCDRNNPQLKLSSRANLSPKQTTHFQ